jgi:acetyl-CoA synthetase
MHRMPHPLPGSRPNVYRRSDMLRVVAPQSIAVVGASERPGSLGFRTLQNLAGFHGAVYPVNGKYKELAGRQCYASLADLPQAPDCVVIALSQDQVEAAAQECARLGVGGIVVFASGYSETGTEEGQAAQARLAAIARERGLRIVGPNTTGFANHLIGAHAGFAEFPPAGAPVRGTIGLVTQSGALGLGLSQAVEHGASISHVLTAGNSCDIDVADHVGYLAEDDACRAIALVFEGLAEPSRLEQAAAIAKAAGKRIVAYKLATGPDGAEAAMRHTGSVAGNDADYDALFARAGILRVARSETLIETAAFFAKSPPSSPAASAAVISSSGGTAIMAADKANLYGVALPQPQGRTLDEIRASIPSFGAARNPCDATAQAAGNPDSVRRCAEAFLSDARYGALVVPWGKAYDSPAIAQFGELAAAHGKPFCLVWMSQWLEGPGVREAELNANVAVFRSMDSCFFALSKYFAG